jgi:hypothetical protein
VTRDPRIERNTTVGFKAGLFGILSYVRDINAVRPKWFEIESGVTVGLFRNQAVSGQSSPESSRHGYPLGRTSAVSAAVARIDCI